MLILGNMRAIAHVHHKLRPERLWTGHRRYFSRLTR
jgi:hypothetical protein